MDNEEQHLALARTIGLKRYVDSIEECVITATLRQFDSSRTDAAQHLKMKRTTFVEKIRRLGNRNKEFKAAILQLNSRKND